MQNLQGLRKLLFCVAAMAVLAVPAWPQASTATSSGTVSDQSGAAVPNASVTLINTATNVALRTKTNVSGFYLFPGVIPGPYKLRVEAPGMQAFEGAMTVQVQQSAVVDVVLQVGRTATAVTVRDVTPILQVNNATLGGTLERTRIEQLPLDGRNVTSLLVTIPGMEGLRSFGTRAGSSEVVLDGSAIADRYSYGTSSRITYRQPGLDSIQEFSVENNSSSAKFSRPANVVLTTKSGTNMLHGSAFETNRNNAYGVARQRQDDSSGPPFLNRNEFGASAGGPVLIPKLYNGKDKTFWFFSYEALRNISSITMEYQVPTAAERNGDMSALVDSDGVPTVIYDPTTTVPTTWARTAYTNNQIPSSQQNQLAQKLMSASPPPTLADVNPSLGFNWVGPASQPLRSWTTSARIDHHFGSKDQFYGRYTQANYSQQFYYYGIPSLNPKDVPFGTETIRAPNKSVAFSYVHTFSPTLFNELLVTGSRQVEWDGTGEPGVNYADNLKLPNMFHVAQWPYLVDAGFEGAYMFAGQQTNAYHSWYNIVDDNATKVKGKHQIDFGFHFRNDRMNFLPDQQFAAGIVDWDTGATAVYDPASDPSSPQSLPHTGDQLANFYLGVAQYTDQRDHAYFYTRQREYAGYVQDTFRLTPRLTVNFGLRYEYNTPLRERNHMLTSFDLANHAIVTGTSLQNIYNLGYSDPSVVNTYIGYGAKFETANQAGLPAGLLTAARNDLGPRAGFTYRTFDGRRSFLIRGGYSTSYFHIPLYAYGARMRKNAPLTATYTESLTDGAYTPDGIDNYGMRSVPTIFAGTDSDLNAIPTDASQSISPGAANVSFWEPNQPDARVHNWNFTLEKEVMANTVLRASYVGNHSDHLETLNSYNDSAPAYLWYLSTGEPLPTGSLSNVARNAYDTKVYGRVEAWEKWGRGNSNGLQLELQRRFSKGYGYQVFYVLDDNFASGGQGYSQRILPLNQYLPDSVPADAQVRNNLLNYQRDTAVPKNRVRWNWIADLPFGKGKPLLGGAGKFLQGVVGGWQVAGMGSLASTYISLPTSGPMFSTGVPVQKYGYKYPIQNCTSGQCVPGYLWWNGYISPQLINSHDAQGNPNGYEGIPSDYKPAMTYLIPWNTTTLPANAPADTDIQSFWNSNTVWATLNDGSVRRTSWSGLAPFQNQHLPSVRQWDTDASIFKTFPMANERLRLRFQLDAFNVFNHPGNPSSVSSTGFLSTYNSGNSARTLQLSLRLSW